jgi:hypothetical protein
MNQKNNVKIKEYYGHAFFNKKIPAIENGEKQGHNFFISREVIGKDGNVYNFSSFPDIFSFLEWQKNIPDKNRNFHELFMNEIKEIYDIDGNFEDFPEFRDYTITFRGKEIKDYPRMKRVLIRAFLESLEKFRFEWGYDIDDDGDPMRKKQTPLIKDSCVEDKISLHLIFPDRYFSKPDDHKEYVKQFIEWGKKNTFGIFSQIFSRIKIDLNIYRSQGSLRVLHSKKLPEKNKPDNKINSKEYIDESITYIDQIDYKIQNIDYYGGYINHKFPNISLQKILGEKIVKKYENNGPCINTTNLTEKDYRERATHLMGIISVKYADDYRRWNKVKFCLQNIFNGEQEGYQLFDRFSARVHKYDDNAVDYHYNGSYEQINLIIALRWLEKRCRKSNIKLYREYREKYYPGKKSDKNIGNVIEKCIDEITPEKNNEKNNEKDCFDRIESSIKNRENVIADYSYNSDRMKKITLKKLKKKGVIAIRGNTGVGKTKSIDSIIANKSLHVCIVNFRKAINSNYKVRYPDYELYDEIENQNGYINMNEHSRVITTIHSFFKIRGKIDVLILDESESTLKSLVLHVEKKSAVYNTLKGYIESTLNWQGVNIICMDANLSCRTVDFIKGFNRKIFVIENTFKKHTDRTAHFYENKDDFMNTIETYVSEGKNIIIACGMKKEPLAMVNSLISAGVIDESDVLKITAENSSKYPDCKIWKNYRLIMYSPTIVAGISFEIPHFDAVFCYYKHSQCDDEDIIQAVNRCRIIKENVYHVFIEGNDRDDYSKPLIQEEMEKKVDSIDRIINNKDEWKYPKNMIHPPTGKIMKNNYYHLYINVMVSFNRNRAYMERLAKMRFINQGVKIVEIKHVSDSSLNEFYKDRRDLIKEEKFILNEKEIQAVLDAEPIHFIKREELRRKRNRTIDEEYQLKRYRIKHIYNISDNDITREFIKKYGNKTEAFKRLRKLVYLEKKIGSNTISNIEFYQEFIGKKISEKSIQKNTDSTIDRLHVSFTLEKEYEILQFLKLLGFSKIFKKELIQKNSLDYLSMVEYIKTRYKKINMLYNSKINWNKIEEKQNKIHTINSFINRQLNELYGITLERNDRHDEVYFLKGIGELWDFNEKEYSLKPVLDLIDNKEKNQSL